MGEKPGGDVVCKRVFSLQEVDNLVRYEIFERKALEAMLFGMDCLVQEVHLTRDVLVWNSTDGFGRASAMGLRRCVVIRNYG